VEASTCDLFTFVYRYLDTEFTINSHTPRQNKGIILWQKKKTVQDIYRMTHISFRQNMLWVTEQKVLIRLGNV